VSNIKQTKEQVVDIMRSL